MIIVAGVHARTGSTLVQRLLCCDPDCMIWGEPPQSIPPHRDGTQDYGLYVDPDISDPHAGFFWNRPLGDPPPHLKTVQFHALRRQNRHVQCGIHHQLPCRDSDLEGLLAPHYGACPVDKAVEMIENLYERYVDSPKWGFKVVRWRWTEELVEVIQKRWPDLKLVFVKRDYKDTVRSWIRRRDKEKQFMLALIENLYPANVAFLERNPEIPVIEFDTILQDTLDFARRSGLHLSQEAVNRAINSNPNPTPDFEKMSAEELGL